MIGKKAIQRIATYVVWVVITTVFISLSIFAPEWVSGYVNQKNMDKEWTREQSAAPGYRYSLTANEKIYILSKALNNWVLPQSDYFASVRERATIANVQSPSRSYSFVVNSEGPDTHELARKKVFTSCEAEFKALQEAGVMPTGDYAMDEQAYDATLYSAVDVLSPQKNVSVWQISQVEEQKKSGNRVLDAYCDAETGKIYGFSITTAYRWADFNTDDMMNGWCAYLQLGSPVDYPGESRFLETTPYYKKYTVSGDGTDEVVITIGFYEGTNELFLRISD